MTGEKADLLFRIPAERYVTCVWTLFQGTLVPKLTLGPFLTLSVRNGHKIERLGFWDPGPNPE